MISGFRAWRLRVPYSTKVLRIVPREWPPPRDLPQAPPPPTPPCPPQKGLGFRM